MVEENKDIQSLNGTEISQSQEPTEKVDEESECVLKDYEICETARGDGLCISIFNLDLRNLIYEKMYIMYEKITPMKEELFKSKIAHKTKKDDLLRNTDFKEVLGITTKPTIADKEAVMAPSLKPYEDTIKSFEDDIKFYEDKIVILNDLIKAKRLEKKLENEMVIK